MKLIESLAYKPVEISFGTSGLRAPVRDMTDLECYINTAGALQFFSESDGLKPGESVYLGGDLRESTPRIMLAVAAAISDAGYKAVYCGLLPTPAMAYYALQRRAPSIMVTGSHIPADRNGIKYYKRGGEVMKNDEPAIQAAVAAVRRRLYEQDADALQFDTQGRLRKPPELDAALPEAAEQYMKRYTGILGADSLAGMQIVVYEQSAVGRDILTGILRALGAEVVPIERSDTFIPIDTENITDSEKKRFLDFARKYPKAFAVVSMDGDSDRPIVIDETGTFQRGDMLGMVTARYLSVRSVAVPLSSNDAVDEVCKTEGIALAKTKVGSPYVIAAMDTAEVRPSVSWEVNGGFLTADDIALGNGTLKPLPTRDAVLPILCALLAARQEGLSLSALFGALPRRFTGGALIDNVPEDQIKKFRELSGDAEVMRNLVGKVFSGSDLGRISDVNTMDGLRLTFASGDVVHLRPSGNAPQFRVYSNTSSQERADGLAAAAVAPDGYILRLLAGLKDLQS